MKLKEKVLLQHYKYTIPSLQHRLTASSGQAYSYPLRVSQLSAKHHAASTFESNF